METIVIALGGNALTIDGKLADARTQLRIIDNTSDEVADIIQQGYKVVMTHGNGPQIGGIVMQNESSANITPAMPFDVCGAMSQGMLGYHMVQGLQRAMRLKGGTVSPVAMVTQVVVDPEDPKFKNPTKPIGPFYTEEEAKKLEEEKGYIMKEDAGRGWRRVVASPKPRDIVEIETIRALFNAGQVVIACGGGGIPVLRQGNHLKGVGAVIDKDFASCLIAEQVDADVLIILTAVEKCAVNFGKPDQKWLDHLTSDEARRYCAEGQFAPGSMLPKVQAAIKFAESAPGRRALITLLEKARDGIDGKTGTVIEG